MAARWEEVKDASNEPGVVKRTLAGAASRAIAGLKSLGGSPEQEQDFMRHVQKVAQAHGQKFNLPQQQNHPAQALLSALNVTPEQIEPQGALESGAQRFLGQAPFAVAGGAAGGLKGILGALGRAAAGSTAATAAESAGLPDWAQNAAQIGTELGISGKGHGLKSINKLKEEKYAKAEASLKEKESGSAKPIYKSFQNVENMHQTETSKKVRDIVNQARETIADNIDIRGNIDIKNAWQTKKSLNKLRNDHSTPKAAQQYIDELSRGLVKVLEEHSPANPEFWKNLSGADRIHRVQSMNSVIGDFIDRRLKTEGKYLKKLIIPLRGAMRVLQVGERASQFLKVPEIRNYYGKVALAAAKENIPDLLKYSAKLDKSINREEKSNQWEDISEGSGWEEIA